MNCENCGNEIEDFAICSDCEIELRGEGMKITETEYNLKLALEEIEELKQAAERTPVELAAEDLLKVCENVLIGIISVRHEDYPKYQKEAYLRSLEGQLKQVLAKIRDNQLCRKNPSGPDECKSVQ